MQEGDKIRTILSFGQACESHSRAGDDPYRVLKILEQFFRRPDDIVIGVGVGIVKGFDLTRFATDNIMQRRPGAIHARLKDMASSTPDEYGLTRCRVASEIGIDRTVDRVGGIGGRRICRLGFRGRCLRFGFFAFGRGGPSLPPEQAAAVIRPNAAAAPRSVCIFLILLPLLRRRHPTAYKHFRSSSTPFDYSVFLSPSEFGGIAVFFVRLEDLHALMPNAEINRRHDGEYEDRTKQIGVQRIAAFDETSDRSDRIIGRCNDR